MASIEITRTVTTAAPMEKVYAYLADFTTTTEWDPGTVRTIRVSGDGGPGTLYRNTSRFLGRETELDYSVTDRREGELFRLRGRNKTVEAVDTMTFRSTSSGGTEVRYNAEFTFSGIVGKLLPLLRPVLSPAFTKLGDSAAVGMRSALEKL